MNADAAATRAELRTLHSGARVLVADDNPVNRDVALGLLTAAGLVVDLAGDGREAVDKAAAADYDLILLDVQMPIVDGCGASRAIRRSPRHATVPILALTARSTPEDRAATAAAGMDDHLGKPLDPAALYAAVGHWLASGRSRPRAAGRAADAVARAGADDSGAPTADAALRSVALVDGLDVAVGMAFFAGRQHAYLAGLHLFAGMYAAGLGPQGTGSVDTLRRALHGAGSACVHVGAVELAAQARRLQALAGDADGPAPGGDLIDQARVFSGHLAAFCDTLKRRLPSGEQPDAS